MKAGLKSSMSLHFVRSACPPDWTQTVALNSGTTTSGKLRLLLPLSVGNNQFGVRIQIFRQNLQLLVIRLTGQVGEILEFVAVQPPGISSSRFQFHFRHTGPAIGFVMRLADDFRRGIFPGGGPTPRTIGHFLAEPHANFCFARLNVACAGKGLRFADNRRLFCQGLFGVFRRCVDSHGFCFKNSSSGLAGGAFSGRGSIISRNPSLRRFSFAAFNIWRARSSAWSESTIFCAQLSAWSNFPSSK